MLTLRRRPRQKLELIWSARPLRREHATLGLKRIWIESKRVYAVTNFRDWSGVFVAWHHDQKLAEKHSLAAAKRVCLQHLRANGERRDD